MEDQKVVIQEINLKIIKEFLNSLKTKTWFGEYKVETSNQNLNKIWNIMYLYDTGYIKSSFLDEKVPVFYTSTTQHPTIIKKDLPFSMPSASAREVAFRASFQSYEKTNAELDSTSLIMMNQYSQDRKYVKGYYCKYKGNQLEEFFYFHPLLTEAGIQLEELLNETNKAKRKNTIDTLIKVGGKAIEIIVSLIPLILTF